MAKLSFGRTLPSGHSVNSDPFLTKSRSHKNWQHQAITAGRMGDKRGYIAHGKAKAQTSNRLPKE